MATPYKLPARSTSQPWCFVPHYQWAPGRARPRCGTGSAQHGRGLGSREEKERVRQGTPVSCSQSPPPQSPVPLILHCLPFLGDTPTRSDTSQAPVPHSCVPRVSHSSHAPCTSHGPFASPLLSCPLHSLCPLTPYVHQTLHALPLSLDHSQPMHPRPTPLLCSHTSELPAHSPCPLLPNAPPIPTNPPLTPPPPCHTPQCTLHPPCSSAPSARHAHCTSPPPSLPTRLPPSLCATTTPYPPGPPHL